MDAVPDDPMLRDAPVFAAPWQARVHALVGALREAGVLEAGDWSRRLGEHRASPPSAAGPCAPRHAGADGAASEAQAEYWDAVVAALEGWMHERGLAAPLQLAAWRVTLAAVPGAALGASLGRRDDPPA